MVCGAQFLAEQMEMSLGGARVVMRKFGEVGYPVARIFQEECGCTIGGVAEGIMNLGGLKVRKLKE